MPHTTPPHSRVQTASQKRKRLGNKFGTELPLTCIPTHHLRICQHPDRLSYRSLAPAPYYLIRKTHTMPIMTLSQLKRKAVRGASSHEPHFRLLSADSGRSLDGNSNNNITGSSTIDPPSSGSKYNKKPRPSSSRLLGFLQIPS